MQKGFMIIKGTREEVQNRLNELNERSTIKVIEFNDNDGFSALVHVGPMRENKIKVDLESKKIVSEKSKLITWIESMDDYKPIVDSFFMTAIQNYCNMLLNDKDEVMEAMERHIISPELWLEIAEETMKNFNKIYKG